MLQKDLLPILTLLLKCTNLRLDLEIKTVEISRMESKFCDQRQETPYAHASNHTFHFHRRSFPFTVLNVRRLDYYVNGCWANISQSKTGENKSMS